MFTGIIEEVGQMKRIARQGQAMVLTIGARVVTEDVKLGDSVAVNGVCLTVIAHDSSSITVDVMPETFRQTTLRHLRAGSPVNLERAMQANGRFGGHMMSGHVDSPGIIIGRTPEENAVVFDIEPEDPGIYKYVLPRGSVALDGISLTVIRAEAGRGLSVSIIPHTLAQTILNDKTPGDRVNIECDMLGKYVEHLLNFGSGVAAGSAGSKGRSGLTTAYLAEHGFL